MENQQAPAGPDLIGQTIADRYRLVRKLGEGGMGEVYEAEHVHIEKRVALKLLRAEIMSNQEAVTRFRQEARSASSIGHRNIIQIDDFGTLPDGRVYLTMEFLQGAPLSDLAKAGLPLNRALDILLQTCIGLGAAHAKGIVHRDMKPDNVFVTIDAAGKDVPKILDFGIAKVSGADGAQAHLTRTGTIFGTPYYMAPEQALGQNIDHRADVYALGVIMYELFAGAVPFKADSFMGILTMHITTPPVPPSHVAAAHGRWLPPELEVVIMRAMAKNPAERFQSMNELAEALQQVYRQYVGAGSTQPLAAQPMSPSQFVPVATGHVPVQNVVPTPPAGMQATQSPPGLAATQMPAGMMMTPPPGMTPPGGLPPGMTPPGMQHMMGAPAGAMATPGSGMSAVAFEQPRKGKGGLIAVMAVLLLGGGGAAGWYFLAGPGAAKDATVAENSGGEGSGSAVTPPEAPKDPPADPPKDPAGDAPKDPVVQPPAKDPVVTPVDATVQVLIDTEPRGAKIYDGDDYVGDTPYRVTVEKGKPVKYTLEKPGYEAADVTVDGSESQVKQPLEKEKAGRPKRPPRPPRPPRDPSDGKTQTPPSNTDGGKGGTQTGGGETKLPDPPKEPVKPPKPPKDPKDDSDELE